MSLSFSPDSLSASSSPCITSVPFPPRMLSEPGRPIITSVPGVPIILSSVKVPIILFFKFISLELSDGDVVNCSEFVILLIIINQLRIRGRNTNNKEI